MTVQRWSMVGQYGADVYVDEDIQGDFVLFDDYIDAIESLEYDIRWYQEQLDILKEERNYYEDKYNESLVDKT